MEVLNKLKPSTGRSRKGSNPDTMPSKEDILTVMETFGADKTNSSKGKETEHNNNSDKHEQLLLSRKSSLDGKWDVVDHSDLGSPPPASLSHSYSLEWDKLFNSPGMMPRLKSRAMDGELRSSRFRSVIWKIFLEVLPPDMNTWIDRTRHTRVKFDELKNKLIINPRKAVDSVNLTLHNPLSQDEESPWNKFFQDNELRLTIKQDVIRTFPEVEFFRKTDLREMMIDILFVFCREHATKSYKQGMHELLAPLIFVLHCDHQAFLHACEIESVLYSPPAIRDVMKEVMDPAYLEHDAYAMFCQVMETVEPWYLSREFCTQRSGSMRSLELVNATPFSRSQDLNPSNAIVTKLTRIQDYILKKYDLELHQHLERLEIAPQIYGIRWLRLLFGREFPMQDLLMLWDTIFGDGIGFDIVDYIFVAMLLYIRDLLLTNDYATCLTILMKYPPVADVHYFVVKALWLREPNQRSRPPNYTHQGGIRTNSFDHLPADSSSTSDMRQRGSGIIQGYRHRHHSAQKRRESNMMGGFSSFSRKFSRPRTLSVPKSSSEPMNLQTDVSPDKASDPIGSTVSLSQVEESMFRHTGTPSSATGMTHLEGGPLRSAQSSPGVHQSATFPLTPDDTSVTSSPTKGATLPSKAKHKPKKLSKMEAELQEQVVRLQGELNDRASMCRYCASKLDVHIGRLQTDLSKQNLDIDDDVMLSLAGLKLVRDVLNGTLKFSQTIADDDDEIQINEDYYGPQNGLTEDLDRKGDDFSTGPITSPESDILLGVSSASMTGGGREDLGLRSDKQKIHQLTGMVGEEVSSPTSSASSGLPFSLGGQGKGHQGQVSGKVSSSLELYDYQGEELPDGAADASKEKSSSFVTDSSADSFPPSQSQTGADGRRMSSGQKAQAPPPSSSSSNQPASSSTNLFTSKIRNLFRSNSSDSSNQQSQQTQTQPAQHHSSKQREGGAAASSSDNSFSLPPPPGKKGLDSSGPQFPTTRSDVSYGSGSLPKRQNQARDSDRSRELKDFDEFDSRRRSQSSVETPCGTYWPDFISSKEKRSSSGERGAVGGMGRDGSRERSKSQPSASLLDEYHHPLYFGDSEDEASNINPLYKHRYEKRMEH